MLTLRLATYLACGGFAALLVLAAIQPAKAHKGFNGWCCNERDCKVAKVQWLPDGRIKATHVATGVSAVFDKNTPLRPLPKEVKERNEWYACIAPNMVTVARCLYHPDLGM